MSEQMKVSEVVELTGLCKTTLYHLMDTGQADLGAVIRGKDRNTYVFFRPKVEKFVKGGDEQIQELISAAGTLKQLMYLFLKKAGVNAEELLSCTN